MSSACVAPTLVTGEAGRAATEALAQLYEASRLYVNFFQPSFKLAAWDWSFYSEKLRAEKYGFDESQLKPYLEMRNVLENGVFYAAGQLYGLKFKERRDLPVYHPDVLVYDVFNADGSQLAIFLADLYARPPR